MYILYLVTCKIKKNTLSIYEFTLQLLHMFMYVYVQNNYKYLFNNYLITFVSKCYVKAM